MPQKSRTRNRRLALERLEDRFALAISNPCTIWEPSSPVIPHDKQLSVAVVLKGSPSDGDRSELLPSSDVTALAGDEVVAEVWVQERGNEPQGIAGGQVDIVFNSGQLSPKGVIQRGSLFTLVPSGTVSPNRIDNLGGATLEANVGAYPEWARLGWLAFDVLASGALAVQLAPGELQFAVYGEGNVPWDEVIFSTDAACISVEARPDSFRLPQSGEHFLDVLENDLLSNGSGTTFVISSVESTSSGSSIDISTDGTLLKYTPLAGFTGSDTFSYSITNGASTATATVTIDVYEPNPWHNKFMSSDVNGDGLITPLDALLVIIELNANGPRQLTTATLSEGPPFLDVNGDRVLSALDALLVIIFLNTNTSWFPNRY